MKKFVVKTLGCKANFSDGQQIDAGLTGLGFSYTHEVSEADVIVVNSCTVTDEADWQSQKAVKDFRKKNPHAKIIYTGCAAEVNPEKSLSIPGVSAVIGNQNKDIAAQMIADFIQTDSNTPQILGSVTGYGELKSRHPMDREWAMPKADIDEMLQVDDESPTHRTRAFIKIQEGCDSFCTYCIIPYGRGPARSLSISTIVEQIQKLVSENVHEVILTGTNLGDFGVDQDGRLQIDDLCEAILTKTSLPRLRVSSLDPTEISDRMIGLMEMFPGFCPHFHVSLQHVSTKILKLMKRKYTSKEVVETLTKISQMKRKPFVGMDYITGFPGETNEDFEESRKMLAQLPWTRLHVFPYSEREGTPATRLPGVVPPAIRKERARILQALSLERMTTHFSEIRSKVREHESVLVKGVLLESRVKGPDGSGNWVSGYSPEYQRVLVRTNEPIKSLNNRIVDLKTNRWVIDRASGEVSWLGETSA